MTMKYVTRRVKAKGREIWYWQRPGFALKRLSDDPVKRFNQQARWNARADEAKASGRALDHGTLGWLIREYQASERFTKRPESTRDTYSVWLRKFTALWGDFEVAEIDKRMVKDLAEQWSHRPASRELGLAVLNNLFNYAIFKDLVAVNQTRDLGLEADPSPARDAIWTDEQIAQLLVAAGQQAGGSALILGIKLMLFTAQRPGDCLAMTWARWDSSGILVRQQKTHKLLRLWCHSELAEALRVAKEGARGLRIVADRDGRPIPLHRFRDWYDQACAGAGIIGMQMRDFRRTAVVRMAEAGVSEKLIASVTGHSIEGSRRILETYLPSTPEMTKAAILQLERRGKGDSQ